MIDRTVHDTNAWLKQISDEMGHPDRQMAYHALRGVLFTLRDRLTVDGAFHLASQLPTLIRGVFWLPFVLTGVIVGLLMVALIPGQKVIEASTVELVEPRDEPTIGFRAILLADNPSLSKPDSGRISI